MRTIISCLFIFFLAGIVACQDDPIQDNPEEVGYFPPLSGNTWETQAASDLNWDNQSINNLYDFLEDHKSRGFILLKNGKIVLEKYWGNNILDNAVFDQNTNWYWASAGKTISATLIGIAQQEGLLDISHKTNMYLGNGWTSMPLEKENLITIKHQLAMTAGLDYTSSSTDCTEVDCLHYKADAGTQWFYHNAPYTLLQNVIEQASSMSFQDYTDKKLGDLIGMPGKWIQLGQNNVFWSTTREAARFGLLIANKGKWSTQQIMTDPVYFNDMVTPSQNLNPSYGYLWWLNGQSSIIYPVLPTSFNISLANQAPSDLFAAMGKNGQFIDIVPSENLVVVRFGEAPDNSLVPVTFHNEMWEKIMAIFN